MRFLIAIEFWSHKSAGLRVLFRLGHLLHDLGHEVYSSTDQVPPDWPGGVGECLRPDVVICGERARIGGDIPLARWVLAVPGRFDSEDPVRYGPRDCVFHYGREMAAPAMLASHTGKSTELLIGHTDPKVFFWNPDIRKDLSLWYQGKQMQNEFQVPRGCLRLTRDWPPTRPELVEILHRCHSFYSFDNFSAINLEAFLCGANVMVRRGPAWSNYNPSPSFYNRFLIDRERDLENARNFVRTMELFCGGLNAVSDSSAAVCSQQCGYMDAL